MRRSAIPQPLADILRAARIDAGWTLRDAAQRIGIIGPSSLHAVERSRQTVSRAQADAIVAAYGLDDEIAARLVAKARRPAIPARRCQAKGCDVVLSRGAAGEYCLRHRGRYTPTPAEKRTEWSRFLSEYQVERCLSQTELARHLDVPKQQVTSWQKLGRVPTEDSLQKVRVVFEREGLTLPAFENETERRKRLFDPEERKALGLPSLEEVRRLSQTSRARKRRADKLSKSRRGRSASEKSKAALQAVDQRKRANREPTRADVLAANKAKRDAMVAIASYLRTNPQPSFAQVARLADDAARYLGLPIAQVLDWWTGGKRPKVRFPGGQWNHERAALVEAALATVKRSRTGQVAQGEWDRIARDLEAAGDQLGGGVGLQKSFDRYLRQLARVVGAGGVTTYLAQVPGSQGPGVRHEKQFPGPPVAARPCGTPWGYQRHREKGEPICDECRRAWREQSRRRRERSVSVPGPPSGLPADGEHPIPARPRAVVEIPAF